MFQECHMEIRKMFKSFNEFFKKVSRVFQGCFEDYFTGNAWVFEKNIKDILRKLQGCFKSSSNVFQEFFKDSSGCLKKISGFKGGSFKEFS